MVFTDGTSPLFGRDANRPMVGIFSDGSVSISDDSGSGIHVTNDGRVIDEPRRGELKVFKHNAEGKFESPSMNDVPNLEIENVEVRGIIEVIINRSPIRPSDDHAGSEKPDSREDYLDSLEALDRSMA